MPIISTWIDEDRPGQAVDYGDLWTRCIAEASRADVTIVYAVPGDISKGALIEVGAALAMGRPVYAVGVDAGYTFIRHPLVSICASLDEAFESILPKRKPLSEESPGYERGGTGRPCCSRAGEYNGYGSDGPWLFCCPNSCGCHD